MSVYFGRCQRFVIYPLKPIIVVVIFNARLRITKTNWLYSITNNKGKPCANLAEDAYTL